MKLPISRTAIGLILAACILAGLGLHASSGSSDEASAVNVPARKERNHAAVPSNRDRSASDASAGAEFGSKLDALQARASELGAVHDLFGASLPPPPVVAAAPLPPPRPVAPAFPYSYIGAMQDSSGRTIYLSNADRVVVARPNQTIDGVYQVDLIEPGALTVTYLPLHQKQTIALERGQ